MARFWCDRVFPVVLLIVVNAFFSGYAVFSSYAFRTSKLNAITFALLRDAVASLCFGGALALTARRPTSAGRSCPRASTRGSLSAWASWASSRQCTARSRSR
jgi:hypothetical protein